MMMMKMQAERAVAVVTTTTTAKPQATGEEGETMDMLSRMRAMKVFNVILARLWRRRCSDIGDLHELVRQYQTRVRSMRDALCSRNRMICEEQRRCDRLQTELCCLKSKMIEKQLRKELEAKTLECNNVAELLNDARTEMFRELAKHRQCAQILAEQQRHNQWLEMSNLELEDQLLTIKDQFQIQHDEHCIALHMKQEQLNEAYRALMVYEQELVKLQIKNLQLVKESQVEVAEVKSRMELMRFVISFIVADRWPNVKFIMHEIVSRFLTYIQHHMPLPVSKMPITSVGICFGIVLLMVAIN